jgi:hypothetical protein
MVVLVERRRLDNHETWELQLESKEAQNFLKKKKKYKTNKITSLYGSN